MSKRLKILGMILIIIVCLNCNIVYSTSEEDNSSEAQEADKLFTTNINEDIEEVKYTGIQGEQSAEDGTYTIISKIDHNKVWDIVGGHTQSGEKVQIYNSNKYIHQKYDVKYIGDGFYKIISKKSGKALTVESEKPRIGSNITQEDDEDLDTQKWILKKQSESVYAIISKCGNLYIQSPSSNVENAQKLELNEKGNWSQQVFIFVNQTPKENITTIEDGIYQIESKSGKVLDVEGASQVNLKNIQLWKNNKAYHQKFRIEREKNTNYYRITAIHSMKGLDANNGGQTPGTRVTQYNFKGYNNQYWLLKDCGDGYYKIISKINGLCLDITNGTINKDGAKIQLYYSTASNAQKFKLTKTNIINNNTYEIETKLNSDKVVNISGSSTNNGAKALIDSAKNANNQRFNFTALSSDTYKIVAKHSEKALSVDKTTDNVYQTTYTGALTQQWQVIEKGNGYFSLICKENGLCLGVYQDNAQDGQQLKVYTSTETASRQFKFVTGFRRFYEEGTYGKSGLAIKGDKRGTKLKYYKVGRGSKSFFAVFSIHGWEDSFARDGKELTYIAEEFKTYVKNNITEDIVNKYTIYIFPVVNPDGQTYGYTHNGPGRTTLYSGAPNHKGIDLNRNWSVGFTKQKSTRNYNGTAAFQAYEAKYLRDFILKHQGSSNILVDTHGWLNETIGDNSLGKYYRDQFGLPKHISSYGNGYLVNWARTLKKGRSTLVELPEVKKHSQVVNRNYAKKWINATIKMLKEN